MKEVELPDGSIAEFPDDMPDAQIEAVLQRQFGRQDNRAQNLAAFNAFNAQQPQQAPQPQEASMLRGAGEAGLSMLTGMAAQPVAGLAGMVTGALGNAEQAANVVRGAERALTFDMGPSGQAFVQGAVEAIPEPVRRAVGAAAGQFNEFADMAASAFGPGAGAAVKTAPVAAAELVGFKGSGAAARALVKTTRKALRLPKGQFLRTMREAVPDASTLHAASKAVWSELDNAGMRLAPKTVERLTQAMSLRAAKRGRRFGAPVQAEIAHLLKRSREGPIPVQEVLDLRQALKGVASGTSDARGAAGEAVNALDDFLDGLTGEQVIGLPRGANLGAKASTARELYRKAMRSEALDEAMEAARSYQGGLESGIRLQFKSLANNKTKKKWFTQRELEVIRNVAEGTTFGNQLRGLGKLGVSGPHGGGLMTLLASGGTLAVFGNTPGAIATAVTIPVIGTVSRKMSALLTQRNAEFANAVIRAGNRGEEIVAAYMRHVPRSAQDAQSLGQLLLRPDVDLNWVHQSGLVNQAKVLAVMDRQRLIQLAGTAAAGGAAAQAQQE